MSHFQTVHACGLDQAVHLDDQLLIRSDDGDEIIISSVRVACMSDHYEPGTNYVFAFIYSVGTFPAKKKLGRNIYPGFFLIKKSDKGDLAKQKPGEGMVHGKLINWYFKMQPSELVRKHDAVLGGGAIVKGEIKYMSYSLNTANKKWQDGIKRASMNEERLMRKVARFFMDGTLHPAQTISYTDLLPAWEIKPTTVLIAHRRSGKALDVSWGGTHNGTNVHIWERNGTGAQVWKIIPQGNDFVLINPQSGKALDVNGGGTHNGTNVHIWQRNGTGAQVWRIIPQDSYFLLINPQSGKALDVSGGGTHNGTNVQIWNKNRTDAQAWEITRV